MRPPCVVYIRTLEQHRRNSDRVMTSRSRAAPFARLLPDDPRVPGCAEFHPIEAAVAANPRLLQFLVRLRSIRDRTETAPRLPATRNPASPRAYVNQKSIRCD